MRGAIIILSCLLWVWFLGCTITWRFGKILLVEGMGAKSIEFVALMLFSIGIVAYLFWEPIGKWVLLVELALWLIEQFFCHEYYTIFGASQRKLNGYNKCFGGSARLFPVSQSQIVPDLYHIILHLLIAVDLFFVILAVLI